MYALLLPSAQRFISAVEEKVKVEVREIGRADRAADAVAIAFAGVDGLGLGAEWAGSGFCLADFALG